MARILFAWELGANLGHLTRDLPFARACRDAGHHVFMAVSNLRSAASLLQGENFVLLQAPVLRSAIVGVAPPVNFADMLLREGYADPAALAGALMGWHNLFGLVRPALLVYNHAPTALLAARAAAVPVMVVGTGFEIPPAVFPLPSFRPWQPPAQRVLENAERAVLGPINTYLQRHAKQPLDRLSALFEAPEPREALYIQLCTFAELDPFGPRRNAEYIGPVHVLPQAPAVRWQRVGATRVFAYLRPTIPECEQLLEALNALDAEVICALPGLRREWFTRFPRLRLIPGPVDLTRLLPDADLAVTYGAGTVATALLAGVPVLLIPQVVEQYLAGLPLERLGAGRMLGPQRSTAQCTALLLDLLNEPGYSEKADDFKLRKIGYGMNLAVRRQMKMLNLFLTKSSWKK